MKRLFLVVLLLAPWAQAQSVTYGMPATTTTTGHPAGATAAPLARPSGVQIINSQGMAVDAKGNASVYGTGPSAIGNNIYGTTTITNGAAPGSAPVAMDPAAATTAVEDTPPVPENPACKNPMLALRTADCTLSLKEKKAHGGCATATGRAGDAIPTFRPRDAFG